MKLIELEQSLAHEQQYVTYSEKKLFPKISSIQKMGLQRTIEDLQNELLQSRTIAKESFEQNEDFDQQFLYLNGTAEPVKRELNTLRIDLITKTDQNNTLQHNIEDEKLKRLARNFFRYFYSIFSLI